MKSFLLSLLLLVIGAVSHAGPFKITGISSSHPGGSVLTNGENIQITYILTKTYGQDVRIFLRPFTNGTLTPEYAASGGSTFSGTEGAGSGSFTISSGTALVDSIRFQIVDVGMNKVVAEIFYPVGFYFQPHVFSNKSFDKLAGSLLANSQRVNVSFNYYTSHSGDVRLYVAPVTTGALSPSAATNPSGLYSPPSGSGTGFFTITSGTVTVDQVRIRMTSAATSETLYDTIIDIKYIYASYYLEDLVFSPPSPSILVPGEYVDIDFTYATSEPVNFKILAVPINNGQEVADFTSSFSGVYTLMQGGGQARFTVNSGAEVDQIKFVFMSDDEVTVLGEFYTDVDFIFDLPTSIDNSTENTFNVYPVPASGNEIFVTSTYDQGSYVLLDVKGRILQKGFLLSGQTMIDITRCQQGIYLLKIIAGRKTAIRKIEVR